MLEPFRFKHFSALHERSAMKIGVDAVLIGAWTRGTPANILDVGCGCGVISLILAQRFRQARIYGIDIDKESVEEAHENFRNSPWSCRLKADLKNFPKDLDAESPKYDLIVSNPPYFRSGIDNPSTPREKARHQASLSVFSLIQEAPEFLNYNGSLSLIFPFDFLNDVLCCCQNQRWSVTGICKVRDNDRKPFKRVMMQLTKAEPTVDLATKVEELTLFNNGKPTNGYLQLCHDFYLKF